jgi:hypothetical protein
MKLTPSACMAAAAVLMLPAVATAAGEPRHYHGTITIDQAPVKGTTPTGDSSMSYRFHARYIVSARKRRPFRPQRNGLYSFAGTGNQTLDYHADLHGQSSTDDSISTYANVADWHGSGRYTKHSGQVAYMVLFGRQFSFTVDLNLPPGTIPLSVSSLETDFFSDPTLTCTAHYGQTGSTISIDDPCSSRSQTVTIPVRTRIRPYSLLSEGDPAYGFCRGPKASIRDFNGFCGRTKPSGRIHSVHSEVWEHPVDYPFYPWEDQADAGDAQEAAGAAYGPRTELWGMFALRTTYTVDLRPGPG